MTRCVRLLLTAILWSAASPAGVTAAPGGSSASRLAQAKQEVLTALSVGNPGHAEEILDRTFRARPDPTLLYQLGLVAQAQGRTVAALDLYHRYQELVGSAVPPVTNAAIESFAATMTAPATTLNVTADPGLLLCIDEKIVGLLPLPAPLLIAGGTHRFRIERRGERWESGTLSIPDSREADLRLTPGANGTAVALLSLSPITLISVEPKALPMTTAQAGYKALAEAARKHHLAPLPPSRLNLLLGKRPAGCFEDRDCRYSIAEQAQARSLLRAWVQEEAPASTDGDRSSDNSKSADKDSEKDNDSAARPPPRRCTVQLEYLDINAGQVAAVGVVPQTVCAGPALVDAMLPVLQQLLLDAGSRARAMIAVNSVPEGAQVRVDGLLRGVTPYLRPNFTGPHNVVIEKDNFWPFRSSAEVIVGQVAAVQAPLSAVPAADTEPQPAGLRTARRVWVTHQQPRPRWRLASGGVSLGLGVLFAGLGASALSRNGQCSRPPVDGGVCDAEFSTGGVGGGLLGVGIALSASGLVLLALPGKRERVQEEIFVDP